MDTLNISIPIKLKLEAQRLIEEGYYASFSDIVRSALRQLIQVKSPYDYEAEELLEDYRNGRAMVIRDSKGVKSFMEEITNESSNLK